MPAGAIPASLGEPAAWTLWASVALTGVGTGAATAALLMLLDLVQHAAWPGAGTLLDAASRAHAGRHLLVLAAAGLLVGGGQWALRRLTSGNATDINAAIWFHAGRLPARRTLGTAALSVSVVGLGASLGREGAPKQAGAVIGNACADRFGLPDAQRRLLVACGAGAGMAAAYGVPLGGALFAIEVLRATPSLRLVLPALAASAIAASVSFLALPDRPTYPVAVPGGSAGLVAWALPAGVLIGIAAVGFVRAVAWTDRNRPRGAWRFAAPVAALLALGAASIPFPGLLGNGKDLSALAFDGRLDPATLVALLALKAGGRPAVPGGRRAGRVVHAVADGGRPARRGAGPAVVAGLAGDRDAGRLRADRGGGVRGRDHAGTDLVGGAALRADRAGPGAVGADPGRGGGRDAGRAQHRSPPRSTTRG